MEPGTVHQLDILQSDIQFPMQGLQEQGDGQWL